MRINLINETNISYTIFSLGMNADYHDINFIHGSRRTIVIYDKF